MAVVVAISATHSVKHVCYVLVHSVLFLRNPNSPMMSISSSTRNKRMRQCPDRYAVHTEIGNKKTEHPVNSNDYATLVEISASENKPLALIIYVKQLTQRIRLHILYIVMKWRSIAIILYIYIYIYIYIYM